MANYISLIAGKLKEIASTIISSGASDSGKIVSLDANGLLDNSVMPVGISADTSGIISSENLANGDYVNIFDDLGTIKVRKAVATDPTKEANGFVLADFVAPAVALVYFEGKNTSANGTFSGGLNAYLSASVAGEVTNTAPTSTGNVVQLVGKCLSNSLVSTEIGQTVELA